MKKILGAVLVCHAIGAQAVDGVSAEVGRGNRDIDQWRLGVQWHHAPRWLAGTDWNLHWDLAVGAWTGDLGTVHDLGLTPVFRYAPEGHWYFEAAIGAHILTDSQINSDLGFSTRFQFGDHVGFGYHRDKYDWSLRLQHLSNGGMRNPNPGINFLQLRLQYWLR